jgi:hypothetical protein
MNPDSIKNGELSKSALILGIAIFLLWSSTKSNKSLVKLPLIAVAAFLIYVRFFFTFLK